LAEVLEFTQLSIDLHLDVQGLLALALASLVACYDELPDLLP
jgi:hypothetical protein